MATELCPLDLAELERPALEAALEARGHRAFHARQIFGWIYRLGVADVARMTDLSRELRAMLADGRQIESVFIPDTPAMTFCVSTQVGCAMACAFCLTGRMGLVRNLTAGEIAGQVRVLAEAVHMREGFIDPEGFAPADPPRLRSRGPGTPLRSGGRACGAP